MDGFTIHPVTLQPPKLNEEGNVEEQEEEQQSGSKKQHPNLISPLQKIPKKRHQRNHLHQPTMYAKPTNNSQGITRNQFKSNNIK